MTKEKVETVNQGKAIGEYSILELKGVHFDNQGKINYLKNENQAIINELNERASTKPEATDKGDK